MFRFIINKLDELTYPSLSTKRILKEIHPWCLNKLFFSDISWQKQFVNLRFVIWNKFDFYRSVVGSGPILIPGKSCSSRYRMKVVFPVEYCPTSITIGFASKSGSSRAGEWKSWKPYLKTNKQKSIFTLLYFDLKSFCLNENV